MTPIAAGLASLGRGDDKMLVHMTPGEVQGLQTLAMAHGGSLTINPQTGLPEAGFLSDILPSIVGIGLSLINPGLSPWLIGGATGLTSLATGKDLGTALTSGLLAGAGAGVSNALANMGADAANAAGSQNWLAAQNAADAAIANTPGALPGQVAEIGAPNLYNATPNAPMLGSQRLGDISAGVQQLGQPGGISQFGNQFVNQAGGKMGAAALGLGALGALGGLKQQPLNVPPPPQQGVNYRPQGMNVRPYDPTAPGGYYFTDRGFPQAVSAARGGEMHSVPELEDGGFVLTKKAVDGIGKGSNERGQRAAAAGLGAIPIRGPGTGTSDSIPTTIDGRRPALVSNGEAYVPRNQVKRRGGAKKFYALMRQAEQAAARQV